jgi:cobaltochelatase CobN
MGIWCVETARDDGALVSSVLHLLGMKPVWTDSSSAGYDDEGNPTGKKVGSLPEVIRLNDLTRPDGWANKRIDVTVITSGLFRDLYS